MDRNDKLSEGAPDRPGKLTRFQDARPRDPLMWLCQYNRKRMRSFEEIAKPGSIELWQINNISPETIRAKMRKDDLVVFWRTVDKVKGDQPQKSRGGIVGWGRVEDNEVLSKGLINVKITHWFPEQEINRDDVLDRLQAARDEQPKSFAWQSSFSNYPGQVSLREVGGPEFSVFQSYFEQTISTVSEILDATVRHQQDTPTHHDDLDRLPLAMLLSAQISQMMSDSAERDGFAVHIHAPWGAGKTSFMNLMKVELEKTPVGDFNWICVDFNAWKHQNRRPPWWPMIEAIKQALRHEHTIKPLFKSLRSRILIAAHHWGWKLRYDWSPYILGLIIVSLMLFALGVIEFSETEAWISFSGTTVQNISDGFKAGGLAVSTITAIFLSMRVLSFGSSRQAEFHFKLSKDPLRPSSQHFQAIMDASIHPVCVLIDDMDRVSPDYVVEILEGIQTSFRHEKICYVVAADKDWIRTCFQTHYSDFSEEVGTNGRSIGYLFLEKIFQLSAPLPGMSPKLRSRYWNKLLDLEPESQADTEGFDQTAFKAHQARIEEAGDTVTDEVTQALLTEDSSPEMKAALAYTASIRKTDEKKRLHLLSNFAHLLPENPRAMKRILNAFTIWHGLSIILESGVPLAKIARWTILEQCYPRLSKLLRDDPSLVSYLVDAGDGIEKNMPKLINDYINISEIEFILSEVILDQYGEVTEAEGLKESDIRQITGR